MRAVGGLLIIAGLAGAGTPAAAGAWNLPKGQGQAIMKYEDMRADESFVAGGRVDLPADRVDRAASLLVEYGLSDRLTVQVKGEWQSGRDDYADYEGRGPVEIGARWQAWRDEASVVAVYAGYAQAGEGRNAGYASPGVGDSDWEMRLLAGRSIDGSGVKWAPQRSFVEAQVARRWRQGLPDEVRIDVTAGAHVGQSWMLMAQGFGGAVDGDGARWLSVEVTAVRDFGAWSLQGGWRQAVAGRDTPAAGGPIFGVWRRF
ncbi:MAG: hypothetical protein P0Y52_04380 [Candidatus Brevundimonas phytovorans]|nr:hypothetical protein [Brevundimonas sp.]WEK58776.1 MAG: hypothetical protein P0Y52_04380 [Brevundimonas sp.]